MNEILPVAHADPDVPARLLAELEDLKRRLGEAEEALRAARGGDAQAGAGEDEGRRRAEARRGSGRAREALILVSSDGIVLSCNPRVAGWLKRPVEQIVGQPFDRFLPPDRRGLWAELLAAGPGARRAVRLVIRAEGGPGVAVRVSPSRLDGERGPTLCLVAAGPPRRPGGRRASNGGIGRGRLLAGAVEHSDLAFAAARADGSLLLANRAARTLLGYDDEVEMLALDWRRDLVPQERRPAVEGLLEELGRGGEPARLEVELRRKDGGLVPVRMLIHAERGATPRAASFCMFLTEISQCRGYEEALRECKALHTSVIDHIFNGHAYCRMHYDRGRPTGWTYLEVNAAFEALFGLKGVAGRRVEEVQPRLIERNPELLELYARVASTGRSEHFEAHLRSPDMWLSISAYCPRPGDFAAAFEVITERKQAEEALRRSEVKFRTLFETLAEGVLYQDAAGRTIDANPAAERILGLSRDRLLADEPLDRLCDVIHPDGRRFSEDELPTRVALRTGARVTDVMAGIVHPGLGRTRWLSVNAMPLFEAEQADDALVYCSFRDVTEALEADRALAASEARFRAYVDWAADAVFVHDDRGRILDVNQQACLSLGYTREELLRMNVLDVEQGATPESSPIVRGHAPEEQPHKAFGIHRRKDGSTFPVEVHFGSFELEGERRYVGLVRDISERKEAERCLQERDELLRMAGEIAHVGGWEFDPRTGVGRVTDEVIRIHDVDPGAVFDLEFGLSFYAEESRPAIEEACRAAVERGVPYDLELEIITARGVRKSIRTIGIPLLEGGETVKVRGIFQDISERKRAEQSLRESQERLEAIVNDAVDAIITIDEEGRIGSFNPAAERMFGYRADEVEGKGLSLLLPEPTRGEHRAHLRRFLGKGRGPAAGRDREFVVARRDGTTFPIELGVSSVHVQGRRLFVGMLRDISERKRAEAALRRSEESYRRIVETAREGVWVHDLEGRTSFANARMAEMLGCLPGELADRPVVEFLDPERRSAFMDMLGRQRHGISEAQDVRFRRADGGPLWGIVSAGPLRDDDGRVIGVLTMVTDVTERQWAQEELRASERKFRALARNIPGVVYQLRFRPDGSHYYSYLSPRIKDIFDFEVPLDSPDWSLGSGVHPDDLDRFMSSTSEAIANRTDWAFEGRCILRDGRVRWFQAISSIQVEGDELAFNGVFLDISERKEAEEEIRLLNAGLEQRVAERTAEIESMLNHAAVGLAFFDRDGRVLRVNEFLAKRNGIPVRDHIGRHPRDLYPHISEKVDANIAKVFSSGEPVAVGEFSLPNRQGDEARSYIATFFPVRHDDGSVFSVGLSVSDITPQKRVERALAKLNEALNEALNEEIAERERAEEQMRRLTAILESSPDFVAIADPTSRVVYYNQAAIRAIGWQPGRDDFLIGDTHPPEVGRRVQETALPTALRDGVWRGETDLLARNGRQIPVSQVIISHFNPDGSLAYFSTIMRDMTEQRALEQALRRHAEELAHANLELARAARLKDEFLANMSHELRTPLNGVLSMAQALGEEVYGPVNPRQAEALRDIEVSGRHLLAIITDILDLTRIEAGTLEYIPDEMDLIETCRAAMRMVAQVAKKKGQHLDLTTDADVRFIVSDERRLKQVLVNLLSNAVKFTPDGGSIGLEVRGLADRRRLALAVHDTGIGIAEEDQARIFEPFTQVDSSLSRQYSGAGLGLALVRQMAHLLGGEVSVESAPGRGSRFTLELDWVVPGQPPCPGESAPRHDPDATARHADEHLADPEAIADFLAAIGLPAMVYPCDPDALVHLAEAGTRAVLIDARAGDARVADILSRLARRPDSPGPDCNVLLLSDDAGGPEIEPPPGVSRLRMPARGDDLRSALSRIPRGRSDEIAVSIVTPDPPAGMHSNIVLMAEDEAINARGILDFLQGRGMCMALASDGEEAVRMARELLPRAILMDVHLPRMDGLEAIRRIRADRSTASIPIIALTALASPADRGRCLAAGADAYLAKPIPLRELLGVLKGFLHDKNREKARGSSGGLGQPDPHR